jgi:hypothetical protein
VIRHGRLCALLWLVAGCTPTSPSDVLGLGDASASSADAGAGLDPQPRGFAVVSSDYTVTMISLLSTDGDVLRRNFIDSGSATTGLVTALSGDVTLPTRSGERGVLVLLDRFRSDVLTRIDLGSGEILGQIKTHTPNAEATSTYSSNPRDYVRMDDGTAWISRYEPNPDASSTAPDQGADLLRIHLEELERTADRVDFSKWNSRDATADVTTYARPSSLVRLGEFLVVGLDVLSLAFDGVSDGAVALIDPAQRKVLSVVDLGGLQSCGNLAPVPDDPLRVAVGCTGFFRGTPRDTAGLAMLVLDGNSLTVERMWRAKDAPKSALTVYGVLALSASEVLATAVGEMDGARETHDTLYRVNLETGVQSEVLEAGGRFVLGGGSYDPRSGALLIPDASIDRIGRPVAGVHRLQRRGDGAFEPIEVIALDDILPPRQVRPFY